MPGAGLKPAPTMSRNRLRTRPSKSERSPDLIPGLAASLRQGATEWQCPPRCTAMGPKPRWRGSKLCGPLNQRLSPVCSYNGGWPLIGNESASHSLGIAIPRTRPAQNRGKHALGSVGRRRDLSGATDRMREIPLRSRAGPGGCPWGTAGDGCSAGAGQARQQFSQAWVPHHSASLPGYRQAFGSARQRHVMGRDADRCVVFLGRLIVRAGHGVDIDDHRRPQNLLTRGPARYAGPARRRTTPMPSGARLSTREC